VKGLEIGLWFFFLLIVFLQFCFPVSLLNLFSFLSKFLFGSREKSRRENRRKVSSLFSQDFSVFVFFSSFIFSVCALFLSLSHCLTVIFTGKILFGLRETEGKGKKNSQWFSFLNNSPHSVFQSLRPFPF
jgi:hypothetical protein